MLVRRVWSPEVKAAAAQRILAGDGEKVIALSRELGVHRSMLYRWVRRYRERGRDGFRGPGRPGQGGGSPSISSLESSAASAERQIAELQRKIGQQAMDIDFLARAFKRVKESPLTSAGSGVTASTERSGQ